MATTRRRRRVGILDVLALPARGPLEAASAFFLTKQYANMTPQAIAVWCRRWGHETFYAAYTGLGDPGRALPDDLDVVFVASYSQVSGLAYALARVFARDGALTVIGGPHAKAFPDDCLRFFDVVVLDCDQALVADIVDGRVEPGSIVSSQPFDDVPTVEERLLEIVASTFWRGRPHPSSIISLLASVGCPYTCDFCIDWNVPYRQLPLERLAEDLRFCAARFPGVLLGFHDPNFAVRFDEVLDTMETVPPAARSPYMMESSLSILHERRMARLRDTNCVYAAPGIEAWGDYSTKAGVGREVGMAKVDRLVEHLTALSAHVPYLQVNFLFGVDSDAGNEPVALTREFMSRTPFVWPVVNTPHPFGGTPLFEAYRRDDRILTTLPFTFYYSPYVATTFRHYGPIEYYRHMITLFECFTAPAMLARRLASTRRGLVRGAFALRTAVKRGRLRALRRIVARLETDREFRAFHERETTVLPEFYHREFERLLGRYAALVSRAERVPRLPRPEPAASAAGDAVGQPAARRSPFDSPDSRSQERSISSKPARAISR
jgi:hypothetical protein